MPSGNVTDKKWVFNVTLFSILAVAVLSLFHKFIFSDQMLYGSDTIQAGVFFRSFYVDYFKEFGKVPVWNPYQFCGIPYIDGFHGDTFYPFSILKFYMNIYRALGWNLIVHVFLAGITMFSCARVFKRSQIASAMAAVSYMFAAFFVSQVAPGHDGKMFATTLFPLTLMFIELGFRRQAMRWFALLGLTIGIIILTPHVQIAYYTLWACAFYFVFKLVFLYIDNRSIPQLFKPSGLFVVAVMLGLAISAIHFYPGYTYVKNYSPRADEKRGEEWAKSWSLHAEESFSLIVPEFTGVTGEKGNSYWGKNPFKDNSEYVGTVGLFLALLAVAMIRNRITWFFGGLALFAWIYALSGSSPFFYLFYYLIPNVKSTRAWSMIMFLFSFSISLLAAFAIDFIIEQSRNLKEKKKLFTMLLFIPPALLFFGAIFFGGAPDAATSLYKSIFYSDIGPQQAAILSRHVPTIATGFFITFIFISLTAGTILMYSRRKFPVMVLWLIVAVALVDGWRFDHNFIRTHNQGNAAQLGTFSKLPIVDYFRSLDGKFRVLDLTGNSLPTNYLPMFGIEEMTSKHGNQPRWFHSLLGGMQMGNTFNPNLMALTNSRFVLISQASKFSEKDLTTFSLTEVHNTGRYRVYENRNALDRARLVHRYIVEPDEKLVNNIVLGPSFDIKNLAVVMTEPGFTAVADSVQVANDLVEIVKYENDRIALSTQSDYDGLLVLADNWYPAWKGFVDGVEVPVLRTNGAFRGVLVPAGRHEVEFAYISETQWLGKILTYSGLLIVGLMMIGSQIVERKPR